MAKEWTRGFASRELFMLEMLKLHELCCSIFLNLK